MKAIPNQSAPVRFLRSCLLPALVLFSSAPALCVELKAEPIIERCRSQLVSQEAVLQRIDNNDQFIVIAARNHGLEGEIVTLKHIIGASDSERVYLYYKRGSSVPVLKLPYLPDALSIEEAIAVERYYAEKGRMTITLSSSRSQKIFHPVVSRKAHHR
jgi:hypothetical protein